MKYADLIAQHNPSQSHWELNELLVELERIDVRTVLEIGMHQGGSARVWRDALQPDLLIGVNERNELVGDLEDVVTVWGRSQDDDTYRRVLDVLRPGMTTSSFMRGPRQIDFLFVDGGHLYDEVKSDFELYAPLVREGGIVAFHDAHLTGNPTCEVWKFWPEVTAGRRSKLIWDGTETGTGEGVVFL